MWIQAQVFERPGQCPLWVKSGHRRMSASCPLYPQQRFLKRRRRTSTHEAEKSKNISVCQQSMVGRRRTNKHHASSHSLPSRENIVGG